MQVEHIAAIGLLALASTGSAFAAKAPDCGGAPEADWMAKSAFEEHAKSLGYEIRNVKVEDGCYEVYGIKNGEKVEHFFNPVTGDRAGE